MFTNCLNKAIKGNENLIFPYYTHMIKLLFVQRKTLSPKCTHCIFAFIGLVYFLSSNAQCHCGLLVLVLGNSIPHRSYSTLNINVMVSKDIYFTAFGEIRQCQFYLNLLWIQTIAVMTIRQWLNDKMRMMEIRRWDMTVCVHYIHVIMSAMACQIAGIGYSTACSGADQRKHKKSASLTFVWRIHRWPLNSSHKGPVTRKMFAFDDVIMFTFLPKKNFIQPVPFRPCRHYASLIQTLPNRWTWWPVLYIFMSGRPGCMYAISLHASVTSYFLMMASSHWWRHHMETLSVLLALCGGFPPVPHGFVPQRAQ